MNPNGGIIIVHSTVSNEASRRWLRDLRARADAAAAGSMTENHEGERDMGMFDVVSLLEPHKMAQNSFTLIQRRGFAAEPHLEPIHTKFA